MGDYVICSWLLAITTALIWPVGVWARIGYVLANLYALGWIIFLGFDVWHRLT